MDDGYFLTSQGVRTTTAPILLLEDKSPTFQALPEASADMQYKYGPPGREDRAEECVLMGDLSQ